MNSTAPRLNAAALYFLRIEPKMTMDKRKKDLQPLMDDLVRATIKGTLEIADALSLLLKVQGKVVGNATSEMTAREFADAIANANHCEEEGMHIDIAHQTALDVMLMEVDPLSGAKKIRDLLRPYASTNIGCDSTHPGTDTTNLNNKPW